MWSLLEDSKLSGDVSEMSSISLLISDRRERLGFHVLYDTHLCATNVLC